MVIKGSAYKHGVEKEDILHALRMRFPRVSVLDEGVAMFVIPARDGRLLEIAVNRDGAVIHAMAARQKFL